jgi:hypothetical protein
VRAGLLQEPGFDSRAYWFRSWIFFKPVEINTAGDLDIERKLSRESKDVFRVRLKRDPGFAGRESNQFTGFFAVERS